MGYELWVKMRERPGVAIVSSAVILIFASYLFLYRPFVNKCRLAGSESRGIEAEILRAREAIDLLKQATTKRTLISEKDISIAIDELTKQGRSKGINFNSIALGKIEDPGDSKYKILPIDIEVKSTYKELAVFLGLLEELEKSLVTVKNLNISSGKEKTAKLNTRLTVNMYLSGK